MKIKDRLELNQYIKVLIEEMGTRKRKDLIKKTDDFSIQILRHLIILILYDDPTTEAHHYAEVDTWLTDIQVLRFGPKAKLLKTNVYYEQLFFNLIYHKEDLLEQFIRVKLKKYMSFKLKYTISELMEKLDNAYTVISLKLSLGLYDNVEEVLKKV